MWVGQQEAETQGKRGECGTLAGERTGEEGRVWRGFAEL